MPYYLAPILNNSQITATGAPLSSGTVSTYLAGTTTPVATYTDNTGGTPQQQPITLNAQGLPPSPVWLLGGQAYKFLIKDSLGNTIRTIDSVYGIGDGAVVGRAYGEYLLNADIATVIPADDTIPQNTEGTQIISLSYTPKTTTNRLRLRFQGQASPAAAPANIVAAIFSSASANALCGVDVVAGAINTNVMLAVEHEYVPATTSTLTISVRVGPGAANTIRMNGSSAGRLLGGVAKATLVVEEIAA